MKHTTSMMYVDIKNEVAFPLTLCIQYSVIRLVRLSDNSLAQSKEQPSATVCIRGTHGRKKCVVSSLPYNLQVIIAIYLNYGSREAIEYIPLLSALNFTGCETQSLIKPDIVLSYCTHSFCLKFSRNSTL